jgi:hypothetical protein
MPTKNGKIKVFIRRCKNMAQIISVREVIRNGIDRVSEDILPEILGFIQFLEWKKEKTILAKACQSLSERSFDKIRDNDELVWRENYLLMHQN